MMRSIVVVLSASLFSRAFALPAPVAENPAFEPKEIKFDGSADWSRIVGGYPAVEGQFPYIASLRRYNSHFCGAAIVSARYLLTAAHCTYGASAAAATAVVGTNTLNSGGIDYYLVNFIIHPNFDYATVENDISLVRTASPISGSSLVASIPISSGPVGVGYTVTLSGWGAGTATGDLPNDLQYINLSTIDNTECARRHPSDPIFPTQVCTFTIYGEGACYGDSGGPLVYNGILVGLVSWGEPCGVGYPDVFTRVSSYVDWIQENAT